MSTETPNKKHIRKTKETMDNAAWKPVMKTVRASKTTISLGRRPSLTPKSGEPASVDGSITSSPPNPTPVTGTPDNRSTLSINVEHTEKGSSSNVKSTSTKQKSKKKEKAEKARLKKEEKEKKKQEKLEKKKQEKERRKAEKDKKSSRSKSHEKNTKTNEKKHTDSHTKTTDKKHSNSHRKTVGTKPPESETKNNDKKHSDSHRKTVSIKLSDSETKASDKKHSDSNTKTSEKKHTDSHTKTSDKKHANTKENDKKSTSPETPNKTTTTDSTKPKESVNKTTEKEIIEEKETQIIEKTTTKEMNSEKILEETEPLSNETSDTKPSDQQSSDEKLPKIGVIGVNSTLVKLVDSSTEDSKPKENDVQVGSPENKSTEIQSKENSVSEVNSSEIDSSSESSDTTETSTSVEDNTAENGSTGNISNEIETIDKMETSKPFDHRSQSTKPEITHDKKAVLTKQQSEFRVDIIDDHNKLLKDKSRYADVQRQFTFYEVAGRGGFSVVHRAKYNKTGEIVALKIIDKTIVRKDQLETLSREIGFVKWCEHKYLLQVYDVLEDDDYIYEVLEYAPGGNLFQHITTTVLTEQQAQWIAYQTASSMFYLHSKGICHRDLKPENILLMSVDDFSIRLVDFGLAKQFKNDVLKTPCGTFDYAPPEMLLRAEKYTHLVDIWSLGVTIFVSMCGYYPFDGNSIAENIEQMSTGDINFDDDEWGSVSKNCKDFIRRCLTADVTKRLNIEGVLTHPWLCGQSKITIERS
ncbi:hypothetical protein QTN25_000785 [Entamoeba marina]